MKKVILFTFLFFSLVVLGQAPTRFPGGVITSKVVVSNSTNDSVLLGAGGRKAINTIVTDTTHLSARINTKQPIGTYATGTGTAYNSNNGDETLTSIKTKLGSANSTTDGYVKYQDWNTFNGKQNALGFTPEQQLTFGTGLSRTGNTITNNITQYTDALARAAQYTANSTTTGLLSSMDWNNFNNKLSSISYNQPSNSSYQLLWGSGNNIYGNSNITCNPYTGVLSATQFSGSGAGITGLTSSQITIGLGYTPWYSGNHPTTISGYGITDIPTYSGANFILNQNSSAQSANMWISGTSRANGGCILGIYQNTDNTFQLHSRGFYNGVPGVSYPGEFRWYASPNNSLYKDNALYQLRSFDGGTGTENNIFTITGLGAATFASSINATGFLLNGNNLTSSLSTNYLPKWNGSSFVNSLISDDGSSYSFLTVSTPYSILSFRNSINSSLFKDANRILVDNYNMIFDNFNGGYIFKTTSSYIPKLTIANNGDTNITSTTQSTSSTTGALVVGGGIGANHITSRYVTLGVQDYSIQGVQKVLTLNGDPVSGVYAPNSFRVYIKPGATDGNQRFSFRSEYNGTESSDLFSLFGNGNVGIGYASDQGYKLAVNGNVFATGFKTSRNSSSYLLATDGSDVAVSTIGNSTSGGINPAAVAVSGITNISSVVGNYITVGTKTIYSFMVGITPSSAAQVFDVITPTNSSYGTVQITGSTNVTVGTCQGIAPRSYRISVNEPSISNYYLTVTIMY